MEYLDFAKLMRIYMKKTLILILFFFLFEIVGCVKHKLVFHVPSEQINVNSKDVPKLIKSYTLSGQKHSQWATTLDVDAVFLSWDVRQALLNRKAEIEQPSNKLLSALKTREKQLFKAYISFYIAVFTTKTEWNNLDEENASWHIYLINEKNEKQAAYRVTKVDLESALQFNTFPFVSKWKKLYKVDFLRRSQTNPEQFIPERAKFFTLEFIGYLGELSLKWEFS